MKLKKTIVVLFAVTLTASMFASNKSISKYPGVTVRTLVQGASIHGANGIYFGPDGNLYIAAALTSEIYKMDPQNGKILQIFGPERGVLSPDDLTFGPDGWLYFTAITYGEVRKINPFDPNSTAITIGTIFPGVNPITFHDDGRLFTALDFYGYAGLYQVDPSGATDPSLILGGAEIYNLNAFDFGPDGCIYGPLFGAGLVRVCVDDTLPAVEPLNMQIAAGAVKFDSQGRLYTSDGGRVLRFNYGDWLNGTELANVPFMIDNLAVDSNNRVYLSGFAEGCIVKLLPGGNYVTLSPGGMVLPNGVAVLPQDGGDSIYVGDFWKLREFDGRTGKQLSEAFSLGFFMPGGLIPSGFIAPDSNNLIIASSMVGSVQEWDPINMQVLNSIANMNMPTAAIRYEGDLIAGELMTGRLVRWNAGASTWDTVAQLYEPSGMATDGTNLWVADHTLGMVYRIDETPIPVANRSLSGPTGLTYYPPDDSLLVIEADAGRLSKIEQDGSVITLAEGLQLAYSPGFVNGVAVGQSGAIYVTGIVSDVLYRIEIHP
jgi:sugar lactone lactonase YvrE